MEPERWQRVSTLFAAALALPADERPAFVAGHTEDPELAREVLALLALEDGADEVLGRALGEVEEAVEAAVPEPLLRGEREEVPSWSGERLGAYVVEERIGRGGMGEVYRAYRADRAYESRVAIKLLSGGLLTGERVRRFHRERQILASLDHPSIARLLDGGSAPDGRPYLVMEYVEGLPIDVYCDRHRLGIPERIALLREVCSAVQTAHRSLVVHRDLKPANVLVTAEGVPKLVDFGIAKLLEGASLPTPADATATSLRPMTLAYASPEQVRGEPITTATDVYSLGVMLYELLTGRLPYESAGGSEVTPAEVPHSILHRDPGRPSTRVEAEAAHRRGVSPAQLRRLLAGDLDNIALTALAKDPKQRYGTAEQLGDDLERHRRGLPVSARPASWGYRFGKLLRRRPVTSAVVSLLVVAIVGASLALAVLAGRLAEERDRARSERDRARREQLESESVVDLLVDLFTVSDPARSRGESITAREMLQRGVERVGEGLEGQPEVRASLLDAMGQAYTGLGLYDEALPLLDAALALRRRELGPDHAESLETLRLLAGAHQDVGDFAAAETLYREALARVEQSAGPGSSEEAAILKRLAFGLQVRGSYDEAQEMLERALAIGGRGRDADLIRAETLQQLGALLEEKRDLRRGEEAILESIALAERHLGADHPSVLERRAQLGNVVRYRGRPEEAEALSRETLAMQRRVLGGDHPGIPYSLTSLGLALVEQGRTAEGEGYLAEALDQRRRLLGDDHLATGVSYGNLAYALERLGRYDEAESLYEASKRVMAAGFGEDNALLAHPISGLGRVRLARGDAEGAEPLLRRALALHRSRARPSDPLVARSESELGACLAAQGRTEEAETHLRSAWESVAAGMEISAIYREEIRRRLEDFEAG